MYVGASFSGSNQKLRRPRRSANGAQTLGFSFDLHKFGELCLFGDESEGPTTSRDSDEKFGGRSSVSSDEIAPNQAMLGLRRRNEPIEGPPLQSDQTMKTRVTIRVARVFFV